jgi:hypothetical protein
MPQPWPLTCSGPHMLVAMKQLPIVALLFAAICGLPARASAENCSGLPTQFDGNQFAKGDFFTNFDNSCYLIPFATGDGSGGEKGDLNSVYNKMYFNINPDISPYELVILGGFPNARYFSIAFYDNHSAITQSVSDLNVVPLTSSDINPFQPGAAFVSGQRYGTAIHLGGTPGAQQLGCMMTGYNVESNVLDGTQRHPYNNWNLDAAFMQPGTYPLHDIDTATHSNPNTSGAIMIRSYLDLTVPSKTTQPHVIVRDVASGCAYPAAYVMSTMNVITTDSATGDTWQDQQQVQEHNTYANWESTNCWGTIRSSQMQWQRGEDYTPGANPDAAYLLAYVPAGLPQTVFNAGEVMRFRFRVPDTPPTPCVNGCSRTGNEQMRYLSISFEVPGGSTLASLPDRCPANPVRPCTPLVQDPNGYVTLVVGTGVAQPSWVTAVNGYTWLDLSQTGPNYMQLNEIAIRNILPGSSFNCAAQFAPYKVGQATTEGSGLMGVYAPVIDYPVASSLPTSASPVAGPDACASYPVGPPEVTTHERPQCGVLLPPPVEVTAVTTQCAKPGCNQVVAQSNPPISILGNGFGSFPLGLPYSGDSNFLEIKDETQNWSAGYTGDACMVTIGEWSDAMISLVANVNHNSQCPMVAGDQLAVMVWDPQTLSSAGITVTVAAQGSDTSRK